jgi:diguanylate cyclase (GGDEF)-like protein
MTNGKASQGASVCICVYLRVSALRITSCQSLSMFDPKASTILIVDDDRAMRLLLRLALEWEGYEVLEANNGEQCLAEFAESRPQMVLLDAVMPGIDGFTCCQELRRFPEAQDVPVLMITVLDDSESVDRAFEAGATDYVTKPIHWPVLCQRVRRLLKAYWDMMQLQEQIERERALTLQLEAANQELTRLATSDGLTGLANRRYFDEVLDREWRRAVREHEPFSLLLCDVDCFKTYNDTYGHLMGDHCLESVAKILMQSIHRSTDLAARYGGEEFAIIMPNTPIAGSRQIANRIQQQLAHAAIPHAASTVSAVVTLSIGLICVVPEQGCTPTAVLTQADQMLYQAKAAGRNQICAAVQSSALAICNRMGEIG